MAATHGVHVGKTRPLTGWRAGGRAAYYPPWNCPFFFHDSLGDEATRVFSPSSHAFVKRFRPILVRSSSLRFEEKLKIVRNFFSFFFFGNKRFSWIDFKEEGSATISSKQIIIFPFVTKYFEIIFSASLFKNSLDEPRNGEERKIAKGKNDKSVGRYSIRIGRRVSRLVEGWRKARGPTIGKQDCWWSAKQELAETRKCRSRIPISHDPTAAIRAPQYSVFLCTAVIIITPAGAFLSLHPHLALRGDPCGERKKEGGRAFLHSSPSSSFHFFSNFQVGIVPFLRDFRKRFWEASFSREEVEGGSNFLKGKKF